MSWLSCLFKPKPWKPTEYGLSANILYQLHTDATDHVYIWDSQYWALSLADWKKVLSSVRVDSPKYLAEKFDCEDFAFLTMTRVTERYEINTCGVAVGMSPMGYHGFNTFVSYENGGFVRHLYEPQTGEIDPFGYKLDTVIFG